MPTGQNIRVVVDGNSIAVKVNPTAQFASLSAFMDEVNKAITDARGGVEHPAGLFTITADPEPAGPLTGEQIVNSDRGPTGGKIVFDGALKTGYAVKSYGSAFSASGNLTFEIQRTAPANNTTAPDSADSRYTVTVTGTNAAGQAVTYTMADLTYAQLTNSAGVHLVNNAAGADPNDSFDLRIPSSFYEKMTTVLLIILLMTLIRFRPQAQRLALRRRRRLPGISVLVARISCLRAALKAVRSR